MKRFLFKKDGFSLVELLATVVILGLLSVVAIVSVNALLKRAEQTYLELRALYHFKMVECTKDNQMRGIEAIHDEVLSLVKEALN